ncbi:MAG TPA: DUF2127 domain-containing protein [Streptosporangiaceae bacterium]|nr:DUF2127 domain-containing protein [Streptosporangiaceae bacterium]
MDWSLLECGRSGHITYAPDEPELRAQVRASTEAGEAWQCLRCAAFVAGQPQRAGPADQAPVVRRADQIRSVFILRIFAVERCLRGLAFGALAYAVWRFYSSRQSIEQAFDRERPVLRSLFRSVGYNIDHSKLVGLFKHALTLSSSTITLVAALLAAYAVVELIEATGLWLAKRWGEYFAMVATSIFLPYEIYELVGKVTVTRLVLFAVNLALVLYLVITKRLFGVRGGKHAYQARLRGESVLESARKAAAPSRRARDAGAEPAAGASGASAGPKEAASQPADGPTSATKS